ncbi:hypothetical protein Pmar_PMAR021691 [Perkinsus marinus ATCC 50983]|uniref:Uncharacterized protein n=1 Tax=Perkinsus marinus (strain ATCC 50983 / TXsc) TaxID=423536 RepID=C5L2E8_PERM5|nr:hypothetical protein Pmar_PMAR000534 [Perkinsus marinus ATCC 50983]XP_002777226.1 hypothetical protein Pmar_PMAR021691 [Perkinsus marinus ATCC 50983]EER03297.1 hypothetical protein Pmar_PMAR000534 [Perkinsus marinus ATCC 50983]EER09042.1 hypothetical protein Pmar_PMAR021691 [Perkinsus marinus ATCC 50983]|eukprot:XP_002771481.1 hypothetical protein Pmar_PMAR000534 [Perkinsus marinus ATCC 50983]
MHIRPFSMKLLVVVMLGSVDAAIPKETYFSTTFKSTPTTCFQVTFTKHYLPEVRVSLDAECPDKDASGLQLKVIQNPDNVFTVDTADAKTKAEYDEFYEWSKTGCHDVLKMQKGDMKQITYKVLRGFESLEASIGGKSRQLTPGKCP